MSENIAPFPVSENEQNKEDQQVKDTGGSGGQRLMSWIERIERLEKQNQRLRLSSGTVLAILAVSLLVGWGSLGSDSLEAERLVIKGQGKSQVYS